MKFGKLVVAMFLGVVSISDTYSHFTLRIACRAKGIEKELLEDAINEWKNGKDVDVEIITLPRASNECFSLYQQLLFSKQCDLDIILLDIAWVGSFVNHLEDLSQYKIVQENRKQYFKSIDETINVDGKLIALPMYADVGVMFYRIDLLEKYGKSIPETWEELYETALFIQNEERRAGNSNFYGYVFQAKATEILTCVFLEMIDSFGGKIADFNNTFLTSAEAKESLHFMQNCRKDICPSGIANHSEEESRGVFQSGKALFMRNWPYAAIAGHTDTLRGKVGMTVIPKSNRLNGKHSGTLGGWNFGVPKTSRNKDLAVDLIVFLSSEKAQKIRAIKGHYQPAIESLYFDEEILSANPDFEILVKAMKFAVGRPARFFGRNYQQASISISGAINTILSEDLSDKNTNKELQKLDEKLNRLLITKPKHKRIGVFHELKNYIISKIL